MFLVGRVRSDQPVLKVFSGFLQVVDQAFLFLDFTQFEQHFI